MAYKKVTLTEAIMVERQREGKKKDLITLKFLLIIVHTFEEQGIVLSTPCIFCAR